MHAAPGRALPRAAAGRGESRGLPALAAEAPGQHQQPPSGSAGRTGRDVQALRCAHHCADLRAGPHRSCAPGLPGTGSAPWSSRPCASNATKSKPVWRGITAPLWRAACVATSTRTSPPALGCRPWSASCRNGTPSAPARASTCAAAGRTGWPTLASPFRSLRISPTWTCPSTAAGGFWTGCPICGQGMVLQVRLCGDAGLWAGAVAPLSLEPGGHGARGPTLVGAGADDGRGLAGRGGTHGQALHQRAGGALRPQPGPRLFNSMRTSNHQVDGEGCSWRQTFTDAAGRMHWDHVFVTELLSNSSHRPLHVFLLGAEYTAVARVRRALAEVPKRYLKCLRTVPKKHRSAIERLLRLSHRDGTPVYRCEPTEGLRGEYREPRMEAEPIREKPAWRRVEDPLTHCTGRREPAADGLSRDGQDASGTQDRGGPAGARGHRAHHHEDPPRRPECGARGADGGSLGASQRSQRPLQRHLAGHRRADSDRYSSVG